MESRLGWHVNEMILVSIIGLQALDFFKLLNPFWDYVKKIVSWVLIGYLLYLTSPSAIFFGEKHKWWDAAVIMSYFTLVLKDLTRFAIVARDAMLKHILDFVAFLPGASHGASVATITVDQGVYNTFTLLGGYLPNASLWAKPFATQLTLATTSLPFTVTSGTESATALLQPYGLNGMILQLYNTLAANAAGIETACFLIGVLLLVGLGTVAALRFKVHETSALAVIHEHGELKNAAHATKRVASVLFVTAVFFVILFNLVVEWLAIAIDAPLIMTGLLFYLLIALRFHKRTRHRLEEGSLLMRINNFGTGFLKSFAKLFTGERTVLLGLSGLLVLHLLVDIGIFLIPYVTSLRDPLYFGHLGAGHEHLPGLIAQAWTGTLATDAATIGLYALNTLGLLVLLFLPAYIWYKTFRLRTRGPAEPEEAYHPKLPGWLVALALASITAFLATPAFRLTQVTSDVLIGVDLQTVSLVGSLPHLILPVAVFLLVLALSLEPHLRKALMTLLFVTSMVFFGVYIYKFFMATVGYYLHEGVRLFTSGQSSLFAVGTVLTLFLVINLLFYIFGFASYVYESVRD